MGSLEHKRSDFLAFIKTHKMVFGTFVAQSVVVIAAKPIMHIDIQTF